MLFLDELAEFRHNILEALRASAEDGAVTLSRGGVTVSDPARFLLVAAMNPCPCGHHGDSQRRCICAPQAVQRDLGRVSDLMERIDLHVEVPAVRYRDLRTGARASRAAEDQPTYGATYVELGPLSSTDSHSRNPRRSSGMIPHQRPSEANQ